MEMKNALNHEQLQIYYDLENLVDIVKSQQIINEEQRIQIQQISEKLPEILFKNTISPIYQIMHIRP